MAVLKVGAEAITGPIVGTDSAPASITTSTTRPYSMSDMDVSTGLAIKAINRKLQIEATLDTVFVDVGQDVVFMGKKMAIPDSVVMRLKTTDKGAKTITIPMIRPLAGPGRGGTGEAQQGYERAQVLKYMTVSYNEYSQAMAGEEWGMNYNDLNAFGVYNEIQPSLSKWFKEDLDKQYHEAILETYSWVLVKTGSAKTKEYNSNFFFPNLALGSQPVYDSTTSDFLANLHTAAVAAATGTDGVNANVDLDTLLALEYFAANQKKIRPVTIGGKKSYLLLLPSPQYQKLLSVNNGQLGGLWKDVSALSSEEQSFPGIVGRVKSLVIIDDQRYPTFTFDTAGTTATIEYCEAGNDDARNTAVYGSSNKAWDIGSLLGANAVVDWLYTDLHFEMEKTEYGKIYGKGAFCERGVQLARFDQDTEADDTRLNYGSIVVPFSATSIVSVA